MILLVNKKSQIIPNIIIYRYLLLYKVSDAKQKNGINNTKRLGKVISKNKDIIKEIIIKIIYLPLLIQT